MKLKKKLYEMKYSVCSMLYVLNCLRSTYNDLWIFTWIKWNKTDGDIENTRIQYTADCILKALSNIYSSVLSTSLAKLEGLSFKCFTIFTKFYYSTCYLQSEFIIMFYEWLFSYYTFLMNKNNIRVQFIFIHM